jgi:hypothetical protein
MAFEIKSKQLLLDTLDVLITPHAQKARHKYTPNHPRSKEEERAWDAVKLYSEVARNLLTKQVKR